jgi:hypothetical protein
MLGPKGSDEMIAGHQAWVQKYEERVSSGGIQYFCEALIPLGKISEYTNQLIAVHGDELKTKNTIGIYLAVHGNAQGFDFDPGDVASVAIKLIDNGIRLRKINLNSCYSGGKTGTVETVPLDGFLRALTPANMANLNGTMVAAYREIVVVLDADVKAKGDAAGQKYGDKGTFFAAETAKPGFSNRIPAGIHNTFSNTAGSKYDPTHLNDMTALNAELASANQKINTAGTNVKKPGQVKSGLQSAKESALNTALRYLQGKIVRKYNHATATWEVSDLRAYSDNLSIQAMVTAVNDTYGNVKTFMLNP